MKFALMPCISWPTSGDAREQFNNTMEQCQLAIENEYDLIRTGHRYLNESVNRFQPIPTLSGVADSVGGKDLQTTYLMPLEHPISIAENFATLNEQFDGTLYLTALQGYGDHLFDSFGVSKEERLGRFVESIQILRELWSTDSVSYSGKYYEFDDVSINPKPGNTTDIPILFGGNVESSVKRAGELGDGYHISTRTTLENSKKFTGLYRDAKKGSDQPDHGVLFNRMVYVQDSTEQAVSDIKPTLIDKIKSYQNRGARDINDQINNINEEIDELIEEHIIGSPEKCIDQLSKCQASFSPDIISCGHNWRRLPHDKIMDSIQLMSDEVIPHFKD